MSWSSHLSSAFVRSVQWQRPAAGARRLAEGRTRMLASASELSNDTEPTITTLAAHSETASASSTMSCTSTSTTPPPPPPSTRGLRKEKKKIPQQSTLSFETFEFGSSPKWDSRFDSMVVADQDDKQDSPTASKMVAANHLHFDIPKETAADQEMAVKLQQEESAWESLSPELVARASAVIRPYVLDTRIQRIESILQQRTKHTRFLFENPGNPSNVWACLRTMDAFGIQHVDVIIQSENYKGKAALAQKRGMRTAMGSAQWLTLRNHPDTKSAIASLRRQAPNAVILASHVSPTAKDIRMIDWNAQYGDRPIIMVMGNEESGISEEMIALADDTFYLPMAGFAESFNLSVATAITLAHLSAASTSKNHGSNNNNDKQGPIRPGDLPPHQYNCLLLKGLMNSIAQKRVMETLFKQEGIVLPEAIKLI